MTDVRQIELDDMVAQMSTEAGRRMAHRLLERAGVFRQTFSVDPYITAFNEGQRSQGLSVLADIMAACPQQYLVMTAEAKQLEERLAAEAQQGDTQ